MVSNHVVMIWIAKYARRLEDRQFVDNGVGIKDRGITPIGRLIVMHSLHFYVYAVYAYNTTST